MRRRLSLHIPTLVALALLAACSSSPTVPADAPPPTPGPPTLTVLRVERRAEDSVILAQLRNPGPDTWTIETEWDEARARIQLPDEANEGWEDCVLYDFCGTGVYWAELRPGESFELKSTAPLSWKRIRLRVRMARGPMRAVEGMNFKRPPLFSDDEWSYSDPIDLDSK